MRKLSLILGVICGLWCVLARGETYKLANGQSITGEMLPSSANDVSVQIKIGEGEYKRVNWSEFSQEDLKQFQQIKKLEPLVEPFIEITQEEKIRKTEVNPKAPPRLERPERGSLLGALFGSGPGFFMLLLLYAANLWAAYEVSIFRAQSVPMVCGLSAVVPIIGPIVFLSMPTRIQPTEVAWDVPPGEAAAAPAEEAVNPMQDSSVAHPEGLKLADAGPHPAAPTLPPTQTFQRGQFTFNRRFFETKFAGFFGVVRREADKDMVLEIKAARGHYVANRITRIAANDVHLQVPKGPASEEVMVPFTEIQEIKLKHKDAH